MGKVADVWSLGIGYVVAGVLYAIRLPFILAVRRMDLPADHIEPPLDTTHAADLA